MLGILAKIGFIPIILTTIVIGGFLSWIGKVPFFLLAPGKTSATSKSENSILYDTNHIRVCEVQECLEMDENLMDKVDRTLNPCDDFYEYVCSSYVRSTAQPMSKLDEIHAAQKAIIGKIFQIVQEPVKSTNTRALQITKQMYQTCVGQYSSIQELKNLIKYVGGWSLLDSKWNANDFSLDKFYARSIERGYFPMSLFAIGITHDLRNSSRNIIVITQAKTTDDFIKKIFRLKWPFESSMFEEGTMTDYLLNNFAAKISNKLDISQTEVEKQLVEFLRMTGLIYAMYLVDSQTPRDVMTLYNIVSLTQMQINYPNIPWAGIIRGVLKSGHIYKNDSFIITCPQCLSLLNDFMASVPTRSLVNFLIWTLIIDQIKDADSEMLEDYLSFISPSKSTDDLALVKGAYCANKVFNLFRRVMDYEYIERHFDKSLKRKVTSFVGLLKSSMKDIINANRMMDKKTRKYAIQKVDAMILKVAYDDEISNKNKVNEYYAELHIDSKQYFKSSLNVSKFIIDKYIKEFRKPAKIDYLSATSGNAAYVLLNNAILLSASVLGGILFSKNRPEYLNFGALGFVIGHEMNHGFDLMGRLFDKHGTYNNWWQRKTEENYWKKVNCFVEQYSQYVNVETGNKVNGNLTLSENLADNGGILVAYKAYVKWSKNGKQELPLPSFREFSPRQMFWLSFASIVCSKISYDNALNREQTDVHALNRIRVNGVVSNNVDFAKDFNCRAGSPMNPKNKCTIWS